MLKPFPQSFWIKESLLCAGHYPGDIDVAVHLTKLNSLLDCGIRRVINLMEEGEVNSGGRPFRPYDSTLAELAALRGMPAPDCLRMPLRDAKAPTIVKESKIRYDLLFMAYSLDYRQLILSKLESGASYRALARDYNLSKTTIQKWKKDINRKLRISKPLKIDNDKLREDVAMYPDDYQHERALRFNCSQRAIGIALKRIGITQKKDLNSPPS